MASVFGIKRRLEVRGEKAEKEALLDLVNPLDGDHESNSIDRLVDETIQSESFAFDIGFPVFVDLFQRGKLLSEDLLQNLRRHEPIEAVIRQKNRSLLGLHHNCILREGVVDRRSENAGRRSRK